MKIDLTQFAHLPIGETMSAECPNCGRRKFYVTRKPGGLAYICFRASCSTQGFIGDSNAAPAPQISLQVERGYKGKQYTGELFHVQEKDLDYFDNRFGVYLGDTPEQAGYWCKVTADDRYAFPLWGPSDEYRGLIVRRPCWDGEPSPPRIDSKRNSGRDVDDEYPKTLAYFEHNVKARCGWYHSTHETTVVIVEDCVSAMRIASEGYTAVAILGTHFKLEFIQDFARWKQGERFILALDPDATMKAIEIARKWKGAIRNGLEIAVLQHDPKDIKSSKDLLEQLRLD